MNDIRKFVIIISICVIGALSLLGLWWTYFATNTGAGAERNPIAVEVETVRLGSIVQRVNAVGTLKADNEVTIHPEIEGKIKKLNFKEGILVNEGDALVEIEDSNYKAKAKEAEALYQFAKLELDRYSRLSEKSASPLKAKEKAQGDLLQAEARFELAKMQLESTVIRAPFAGIIGLKQFSVGAYVDPRTELLTIVDVDPIKVDYRVPAKYLRSIGKGQEVKVTVDGFTDQLFKATIEAIDPKIDPNANSVLVRAYIPNENGKLKPGLFARVNMVVGSKDNSLLLPESAVLTSGEESFVYRVMNAKVKGVEQKVAVKRAVVTGMSESGVIEIAKGLSEGDQVISVGLSKIQEGITVRIVEDAEAEENFAEDLDAAANGQDAEADETEDKKE